MNSAQIFLSTKIEERDLFSGLGNLGLAPIRYFFHGRNIKILPDPVQQKILLKEQEVHHVGSFSTQPYFSKTTNGLISSNRNLLKTVAAIVFLIPGLCLGSIFKGLSYLSKATRDEHGLIKKHFTPVNRTIGSLEKPLNEEELQAALRKIAKEPLHQKINALTIYGKDDMQLKTDPGFRNLDPKKVIFVGARIINGSSTCIWIR